MGTKKKSLFTILLCILLFSTNGFAQERTNVIKANPFGLALGNFNVTYEKVLNSKSSVIVKGTYAYKLLGTDLTALGLGAGYRYYFTHSKTEVPSGFWVTPQAGFEFGSIKDDGDTYSMTAFSVGAEVGYQWAWRNGFTLDLGIGPNYVFMNTGDYESGTLSGITPSLTLAIGYAF